MWRNILVQAAYQLAVLFCILFLGASIFRIHAPGWCNQFSSDPSSGAVGGTSNRTVKYSDFWDPSTDMKTTNSSVVDVITCSSFVSYCPNLDGNCYHSEVQFTSVQYSTVQYSTVQYSTVQCVFSYLYIRNAISDV